MSTFDASFDPASRRDFLRTTGTLAAATSLVGMAVPRVHAADSNTIQVALVGCGGRGTGAAANALSTKTGPIKLVAMADVFENRLKISHESLKQQFNDKVDVPAERRFVGFDGYKQAMDCLKPGDVAIFATPPGFRWVHFSYAIEKGINVFMEKPVTVDGPSTKRMLALAEKSVAKNLKVGVGLMCRHCDARQELFQRIQDGQIGDLIALRCYRMHGPVGSAFSGPKPDGISDLMYQIQRFHSFLWASGGLFSDFYIHNIDECCWMKNAWPVQAQASGGRQFRGDSIDQNFD
ncbi:MAG: Gfo/Idh/MocA family protein, partial [Planctomycetota bacterium]